jgi:hypothetical protein
MPHEVISTQEDGSLLVDMFFSEEDIYQMFPCMEEDGDRVQVSDAAVRWAQQTLAIDEAASIQWHAPDVFAIRYGSSFVASARSVSGYLRFHHLDGDLREGDDR